MSRPITSEILDRADLTASEKLVLIAIASHGAVAFPSQPRLARLTSLSLRTVKAVTKALRARGVLVSQHGRKSLTYSIVGVGETIAPMVQPLHQHGATIAPLTVQPLHPNSQGNSQVNSPPNPQRGNRRARASRREEEARRRADPNWVPF